MLCSLPRLVATLLKDVKDGQINVYASIKFLEGLHNYRFEVHALCQRSRQGTLQKRATKTHIYEHARWRQPTSEEAIEDILGGRGLLDMLSMRGNAYEQRETKDTKKKISCRHRIMKRTHLSVF